MHFYEYYQHFLHFINFCGNSLSANKKENHYDSPHMRPTAAAGAAGRGRSTPLTLCLAVGAPLLARVEENPSLFLSLWAE